MRPPEEYLNLSAECARLARAANESEKATLLKLADLWAKLAGSADNHQPFDTKIERAAKLAAREAKPIGR